jgi:hypothetical protein
MNTAARLNTGTRNRVHISSKRLDLLIAWRIGSSGMKLLAESCELDHYFGSRKERSMVTLPVSIWWKSQS